MASISQTSKVTDLGLVSIERYFSVDHFFFVNFQKFIEEKSSYALLKMVVTTMVRR